MSRTKGPRCRLVALLAVLALLGAACGDDDEKTAGGGGGGGKDAKTYYLAFVGPLTGDAANLGINIRDGIKVALDEFNADSEDVKVELKEFDTQGDPAQAGTKKDEFISDDEIIGIIGPAFSGETKAVLPDLEAAGLVMISASATNAELPTVVPNSKVFHRIIPDDDVQGQGVTAYLTKVLKATRVAYVHDNSEYGKGLAEGTQKLLTAAGVQNALPAPGVEVIDPKSQDFSAAVNKVKASGATVIFYGGYYAEAGRLKKQLKDANVTATFISGDGALDPGFVEAGGPGADGAQITCPCNLATVDSPGKLGEFAKTYEKLIGKDPGTYSTEGYDATNIFLEGIEAGNTDREKLLAFVEDYDTHKGISKDISFEENGNVRASDVFVFEIKAGKITLKGKTSELVPGGGSGSGAGGAATTTTAG